MVERLLDSVPKQVKRRTKRALDTARKTRAQGTTDMASLRGFLAGEEDSEESDSSTEEETCRRSSRRDQADPVNVYLAQGRSNPPPSTPRDLLQDDGRNRYCAFCGRRSHSKAFCRRKLGLCVVCGASDHQIDTCGKARNRGRSHTRQPGSRPRERSRTPGSCFKCGQEGHFRRECPSNAEHPSVAQPTAHPAPTDVVTRDYLENWGQALMAQITGQLAALNGSASPQGGSGSL